MKRKITLVVVIVLMLVTMAACGGGSLSGTYSDATGTISYVFDNGEVSMVMAGMSMPLGTFEVKSGNLYISGTRTGTVSGRTITIEGVQFTR